MSVKQKNNIKLPKEQSEKLFYKFKDLGMEVGNLGAIVQNPDFACKEDIKTFLEECNRLEQSYIKAKNDVIELFNTQVNL